MKQAKSMSPAVRKPCVLVAISVNIMLCYSTIVLAIDAHSENVDLPRITLAGLSPEVVWQTIEQIETINRNISDLVANLEKLHEGLLERRDLLEGTSVDTEDLDLQIKEIANHVKSLGSHYIKVDMPPAESARIFDFIMRHNLTYPYSICPPPLKAEYFDVLERIAEFSSAGGWGDAFVSSLSIRDRNNAVVVHVSSVTRHILGESVARQDISEFPIAQNRPLLSNTIRRLAEETRTISKE